jgi:phosphoserine phosphatase SerB
MNPPRRLIVTLDDQVLEVFVSDSCICQFSISSATKGMGFVPDTHRTPTGRFRIAGKIGAGEPVGTIFKARVPVGLWRPGDASQGDLILTRILLLDGLDPENANSLERCIYIHGTNHENKLGQPVSHGCIRLGNSEMVELFDRVEEGDEVIIHPITKHRGKLFFIDCDSTLSTIEGIDELARARGAEVFERVVALTHAAMNGTVPISEVFFRRMEMIRPDRVLCDQIAELYVTTLVPGVREMIDELKHEGWLPVILSGGFAPLIQPLARLLGIAHVEAVPIYFHEDGSYQGYDVNYPTTRNLGKNEVIREWKQAMLPERVVMMGDGVSDLETQQDVDLFIGFGGVVARPNVKNGCDHWLTDIHDKSIWKDIMAGGKIEGRMV